MRGGGEIKDGGITGTLADGEGELSLLASVGLGIFAGEGLTERVGFWLSGRELRVGGGGMGTD